jgi:hypothetical protein
MYGSVVDPNPNPKESKSLMLILKIQPCLSDKKHLKKGLPKNTFHEKIISSIKIRIFEYNQRWAHIFKIITLLPSPLYC